MHRFKFTPDDLFINRLKTYPEYNVFIYQGQMHVNRDTRITGSGGITVYDVNSNRTESLIQPFVVSSSNKPAFKIYQYQPLVKNHSGDFQWASAYVNGVSTQSVIQSLPVYADLNTITINNTSNAITASYGIESPITRQLSGRINSLSNLEYYDITGSLVTSATFSFPVPHNPTASALQNVARK